MVYQAEKHMGGYESSRCNHGEYCTPMAPLDLSLTATGKCASTRLFMLGAVDASWTYLAFPTLLTTIFDCFEAINTHGRISRLSSKDTNAASSPAGSEWSCAGWNMPASQLLPLLICSYTSPMYLFFHGCCLWAVCIFYLTLLGADSSHWLIKNATQQ